MIEDDDNAPFPDFAQATSSAIAANNDMVYFIYANQLDAFGFNNKEVKR